MRLKLEYDKANNPENMVKFKEEALRYQAMNPKPELPEDARRFRVQAEGSVSAKRFLEAAERYGKAIEIAPGGRKHTSTGPWFLPSCRILILQSPK